MVYTLPSSCFLLLLLPQLTSPTIEAECGFQHCPKTTGNGLHIHVIAHSEMSAGYTETPDQVYEKYGKKVYTNVIDALTRNASRKFTISQVASFAHWFEQLSLDHQITVYSLVRNEQLTFVGGGWTEADEAVTHYHAIIDDLTLGQDWLKKRFQECGSPRIAWQFTSLSHSAGFASLLAQSLYDMLFMFKLDSRQRDERRETQQLEFIRRSGGQQLLVSIPYGLESLPEQFHFDSNWYPISQEELNGGATRDFVRYVQKVARAYATRHMYILMGKDFSFRNAEIHFQSIENLMAAVQDYVNASTGTPIDIFYSSPNCYMKALYDSGHIWPSLEEGISFVSNSESSERDTFQSGFFTSRASLKQELRQATSYLETAKQLAILSGLQLGSKTDPAVRNLRFLLSLASQSKFVAGISSQQVSSDFQHLVREAIVPAISSIASSFSRLAGRAGGQKPEAGDDVLWKCFLGNSGNTGSVYKESAANDTRTCILLSGDELQQEQQEEIRIYNPFAHSSTQIIRLPVSSFDQTFLVMNWQGYDLQSQLLPIHPEFSSPLSSSASSSCGPSNSETASVDQNAVKHELVFNAILPAMGFTSFVIRKRLNDQKGRNLAPLSSGEAPAEGCISNDFYQINYDALTGAIRSLKLLAMNQTITFTNKWIEFETGDKSNHYNIDTNLGAGKDLNEGAKLVRIVKGPVVEEIHCVISPLVSHVLRVYRGREEIECEWIINSSSSDSGSKGKELFLRIQSEAVHSNYFMTDSNCKESIKRSLNTLIGKDNDAVSHDESETLVGNLYPVNCFISIQDENLAIAVVPDRPEAGTSITAGRIDMLVHRSTSTIPFGSLVPEPLAEDGSFRGKHVIFVSTPTRVSYQVMHTSKSVLKAPVILLRDKSSVANVLPPLLEFSCLNSAKIAPEINILSLDPWSEGRALIRLEHRNEYGSGNDVSISLRDAFSCIKVSRAQEMTLTAASVHAEAKKKQLMWNEREFDESTAMPAAEDISSMEIRIHPGEIRTFILWLDE